MCAMARVMRFRIRGTLPVSVVGPKTRWVVMYELSGKGGKHAAVRARCLTNGKSVMLLEGRENFVSNAVRAGGLMATEGTIACKILLAMAAQGTADVVSVPDESD